MNGYLILSLQAGRRLLKKINTDPSYKKLLFITDRIIVYNLLIEKRVKVILISRVFTQKEFNSIFKKEYEVFNKALKRLDDLSKNKINFYYNTFRYVGPRNYAGLIIILKSLKILVKKFKIKKLYLNPDIKGSIFNNYIYGEIFKRFCKVNSIHFQLDSTGSRKNNSYLNKISNLILEIRMKINNYSLELLKLKIKKIFTKICIFKTKNPILIIEPEMDLFFMKYKILNTYFKNFSNYKKFYYFSENKKEKDYNSYLELLTNYLKNNLIFDKKLILSDSQKVINFIKTKKISKIYWGVSPNPYFANILNILKLKKIKSLGVQHGGKYFIQQDDIYHKDSDYAFCDKFLAYGVSKYFNHKKYTKNKNNIIDNGCFKSNFLKKSFENLKKNNNKKNILYVPTSSKFILAPVMGSIDYNHYEKQSSICKVLNQINFYKVFVKIIPRKDLLEYMPINYDLKKYKNLSVNFVSLTNAINILKPKIIITDSLSTSIYDLLYTNSEIIIFLDKNNFPKKDAFSLLSKRVFFVNNHKEMKSAIIKLRNNHSTKKTVNEEFIKKFHLLKKPILQ